MSLKFSAPAVSAPLALKEDGNLKTKTHHHPLVISAKAYEKITHILKSEPENSFFRVAVEGGGCSGYQYQFNTTQTRAQDDIEIAAYVLVDTLSATMLQDCTLDYVKELIGERFEVQNPHAKAQCGCGISFSL